MDSIDRQIINRLQDGIPICECPYASVAEEIGTSETELLDRIQALLENKTLSRFGPMYDASRFGGHVTLAALRVAKNNFDKVTDLVNQFPEVAHNYRREHEFNMWFVISAENPRQVEQVIKEIENQTGLTVYNMPKLDEFYVGLKFAV